VLLSIAAPSMQQLIATERLKNINAQFVTDIQAARSLAVAQNNSTQNVFVQFQKTAAMSCYVAYYYPSIFINCDCTRPPGSVCTGAKELHSVQIPTSTDVQILPAASNVPPLKFADNGMLNSLTPFVFTTSHISGRAGTLQTTVPLTGRPSVCSPDNSVSGTPIC
ncbi:MAG: hypothetical protein KGI35_10850, partial [Burkholderiales bacterium]|nr:hypothetical protein [Burkholderiales bacterium]